MGQPGSQITNVQGTSVDSKQPGFQGCSQRSHVLSVSSGRGQTVRRVFSFSQTWTESNSQAWAARASCPRVCELHWHPVLLQLRVLHQHEHKKDPRIQPCPKNQLLGADEREC